VQLPGSVSADLEEKGCMVELRLKSDQLTQLLDTISTHSARQRRKGPLIHCSIGEEPLVVGLRGKRLPFPLGPRQRKLVNVLAGECRSFNDWEIEELTGIPAGQVKVYVQRVNRQWNRLLSKLQVLSRSPLIRSTVAGYRLFARVKIN